MKLLRLKLGSSFRSLHSGFEINFLRDFDRSKGRDFGPYCLVGRNGSGKSNVLEVLAAIFYHIECIHLKNKPEGFDGEGDLNHIHTSGFFPEHCDPDSFELEYLCYKSESFSTSFSPDFSQGYEAHILITKTPKQAPVVSWLNRSDVEPSGDIHLSSIEVKGFLPEYIVGYSSGENEVLSLPFFKMRFLQFDEYEYSLRNSFGYSQPEGRMVYVDTQFSQAVLLTNYLMQDDAVLSPLYANIGIESISQFRIIINYDQTIEGTSDKLLELNSSTLARQNADSSLRLLDLLEHKGEESTSYKALDKLRKCATLSWLNPENGQLYLDYYIDQGARGKSQMKNAFRAHFNNNPFELFSAFQILLTLNLYNIDVETKLDLYKSTSLYVKETVPISASNTRIMRFKDFYLKKAGTITPILMKGLSDGEHQFLHIIGMCLLFRNTNSLFLLDEPETHFNPGWRAKFLSTLRDCLTNVSGTFVQDILITSHSPFIISDSHEENVLIFKKDKTQQVSVERPGFNTFGASVNQITMKVFERSQTIGNYSNELLTTLYQRLDNGENKDLLIDLAFRYMGDSVERVIFINKAMEK